MKDELLTLSTQMQKFIKFSEFVSGKCWIQFQKTILKNIGYENQ